MESEKEWNQHIDKLEKITKKYRDKYYAAFVKKYTLTKNYAVYDVKNDKFVLDKDNYRSATKYAKTTRKFGNWCNYNCKSGKLIAEQLMVECTETVTSLDCEDLNSSDDEWETEESSDDGGDWEPSDDEDDEMEDLGSTFHERKSENKEKYSKEYEYYSLARHLAAISLDEICPLSRTRFPTLSKQVSTVQTEVITDDAVKGPLGIGKSGRKRKETLISLEVEKKYFRCDILKESLVYLTRFDEVPTIAEPQGLVRNCSVRLTRFDEVPTIAEPQGVVRNCSVCLTRFDEVPTIAEPQGLVRNCSVCLTRFDEVPTIAEPRGLVRNCFVRLSRFDEGSANAKCQPLNSEICSEMRATEKPNKRCVQASSERIIQISNVEKFRCKKFAKCRKSGVRYCKSVYSVKSLIQHGQFGPSCSVQSSLDRDYLEASFNEDYDSSYFEPQKGKRKSKITEFDDELPSPKRSSNAASNSISLWNGNKQDGNKKHHSSNSNVLKDRNAALKSIAYLFEE